MERLSSSTGSNFGRERGKDFEMFLARRNVPLSLQDIRATLRLAILILIGVAALVLIRGRQVKAKPDVPAGENTEIARTYDFKFGSNPCAPGTRHGNPSDRPATT